ncbi:MAG: hypothetical protein SVY41_01680 [Candidatus Nanohaloarchaea archaeon]|nr:hypothetical protein [Candidatus Nanohaloarchaea archaeon]
MSRDGRWTAADGPEPVYEHGPVPEEIHGYAHLVERYWESGESVEYFDGAVTNDAFRDGDRVVKDTSFSALPSLLTVYKAGRSLADLVVGPLQGRQPCLDIEYLSTADRVSAEEDAAVADAVDGPDVFWRDGNQLEMEYLPDEPVPTAVRRNDADFAELLGTVVGDQLRGENDAGWGTRESRPENFILEYSPIDTRYLDDGEWGGDRCSRLHTRRIDNEYGTADASLFDTEMQQLTLLSGMKNLPPEKYPRFRDGVEQEYGEFSLPAGAASAVFSIGYPFLIEKEILGGDREKTWNAVRNAWNDVRRQTVDRIREAL